VIIDVHSVSRESLITPKERDLQLFNTSISTKMTTETRNLIMLEQLSPKIFFWDLIQRGKKSRKIDK